MWNLYEEAGQTDHLQAGNSPQGTLQKPTRNYFPIKLPSLIMNNKQHEKCLHGTLQWYCETYQRLVSMTI
jgi:hypothetical protein